MRESYYESPYGPPRESPRESPRQFSYDKQGRLTAAGSCHFTWTDSGSLRTTQCNGKTTQYHYGDNTRLDTVLLPTGAKITYQYAKGLLPVGISRNGLPVMEFSWKNTLRLTRYMDRINSILYVFSYDNDALKQVTLSGPEAVVSRLTGQLGAHLKLNISVDQLGSIRRLETPDGVVVKTVEYDSFGNVMHDSRPKLYFPLGFAGGLSDPFTGFTRFGFRDYDPNVGRFTAPDPLGDTGGDHDLYDYCVDDPVSRFDPSGLDSAPVRDPFYFARNTPSSTQHTLEVTPVHEPMSFVKSPSVTHSTSNAATAGRESAPMNSISINQPKYAQLVPATTRGTMKLYSTDKPDTYSHNYLTGSLYVDSDNSYQRHPNDNLEGSRLHSSNQKEEAEPELSFVDALVTGMGNLGSSAQSFASDLWDALSDPLETGKGVGRIVAGYSSQLFDVESDYRAYSDAVTEYFGNRYGSYANFKRTLAKDPVGVAGDLSAFLTAGSGALRGIAKAGTVAARALPAGCVATAATTTARGVGKTGTIMATTAGAIDPLSLPVKAIIQRTVKATKFNSKKLSSILNTSFKLGTILSRVKTPASLGGTVQTIDKERQKREQ